MDIREHIAQIKDDDKSIEWHVLHQLLELAMAVTGRGDVSDDYTKSIEFPLGDAIIFSDPYYGCVQIDETDLTEKEILGIIAEIEKRLIQFDKKTSAFREQSASEIFDRPLKGYGDNMFTDDK